MPKPTTGSYEFGTFRLDAIKRLLLRDGEVVQLPPKAFETLLILIENSDRVVEKSELMEAIWPDSFVEEANLTQNVSVLRKALGERAGEHRYIVTVPGRGYRFAAEIGEVSSQVGDLILERHAVTEILAEREEVASAQGAIELDQGLRQKTFLQTILQTKGNQKSNTARLVLFALALVVSIGAVSYVLISRNSSRPQSALQVKSIAVLPFKSLSPETGDEHLGLGIADTLITRLSGIKNLILRPTSAVRKYADQNQDPLAAGREQQVDAVLDGSIQKTEGRVRVTARLLNVQDGSALWAGSFDEKYEDIFRLQDSIIERLTNALMLKLSGEEQRQLARRETMNSDAYQFYLKGRYFWSKRGADGLKKAIEQFQQAIERDPNFALGYVGLADCYLLLIEYGNVPAADAVPRAQAAVARALELDDSLAEAHTSAAYIHWQMWRWAEAEEEFKQAISLNPNYATAHQWYAGYFQSRRQFDDALREIQRAQQLDPLSPIISHHVAWIYLAKNDLNSVIEECKRMTDFGLNTAAIHNFLGSVYLKQGRYAEATAEFQKSVEMSGRASRWLGPLGYCDAVMGRRDEAVRIAKELEERYAKHEALGLHVAQVYAGLGEKDQAFAWLEKDFERHSGWLQTLTFDYSFDNLRLDPRYADLVRRIGLTP